MAVGRWLVGGANQLCGWEGVAPHVLLLLLLLLVLAPQPGLPCPSTFLHPPPPLPPPKHPPTQTHLLHWGEVVVLHPAAKDLEPGNLSDRQEDGTPPEGLRLQGRGGGGTGRVEGWGGGGRQAGLSQVSAQG